MGKNGRHDSSRKLRPNQTSPATAQPLQKKARSVIGVEATQTHTRAARTCLLVWLLLAYVLVVAPVGSISPQYTPELEARMAPCRLGGYTWNFIFKKTLIILNSE
ncbi:hypothetical protein AVEN_188261-1 [Araneus ventricosus]|uniref:Uncharacterized protein n=1 Tax=Araneus ventricosus TaxID=182803 RepID=A0A4Y2KPM4_ARAVE|nr:hypothetical protein AVEN_188261-1 [Araneus ventricosus]